MRRVLVVFACLVGLAGCRRPALPPPADAPVVFEGARLITGDGTVIESSAFVVANGHITQVGEKARLTAGANSTHVDLTGKTVMPAVVDDHSHLGYTDVRRMTTSAADYTRENLTDHLERYAYYGIAATLSMGVDRGDLPYQIRNQPIPGAAIFRTAGRGIALPNAGPGAEYRRDAPYGVSNAAEARAAVQELKQRRADIVKIWVDDRDGTVPKLPPALYRTIIDEAHAQGLRVVAHIFDLADAKDLLRAGIDGFAHGVRDRDVDEEFMALLRSHPQVWVIPNLPDRDSRDDFAWLSDNVPPQEIQRLRDAVANRTVAAAKQARELYDVQARNLARLNAAGVKIGFGTDAGVSVGWSAHTELADMVAAGMTPAQALRAATQTAAEILRLEELGTITAGKSADFIVLDANPLDDIVNTRRIARVYLRGQEVNRAVLRARWTAAPAESE